MKTCLSCKAANADTARYCTSCAKPLPQQAGRPCPAGLHTMDPGWTECEYCKSDASAGRGSGAVRRETVLESALTPVGSGLRNAPRLPAEVEGAGQMQRPVLPRVDPPPPPPPPIAIPAVERGATIFRPNPAPAFSANPEPPMPSLSRRKIVGILISYSWHPDGKVFPVYEERNLIGRGEHCQIHVPEDTSMSDENSHIFMITRNQKYLVGDKGSLNGTYLNGERILETFHPLPNYALIRAGATDFTFMMVQPPATPDASNSEGC